MNDALILFYSFLSFSYYSLGGLGKAGSVACVSNIIVNNISFQNTQSGVRIKTWPVRINKVNN